MLLCVNPTSQARSKQLFSVNAADSLDNVPEELQQELQSFKAEMSAKTQLFDPNVKILSFSQTCGRALYSSMKPSTKQAHCTKQFGVDPKLTKPLYQRWLALKGFLQDGNTFFTTDPKVVISAFGSPYNMPSLINPMRRAIFCTEVEEQQHAADFDNVDPLSCLMNPLDAHLSANDFREASKKELGDSYPDLYDTRGKKPSIEYLRLLLVNSRFDDSQGRRIGMKAANRVLVTQNHPLKLVFKRPHLDQQTVVLEFHLDGRNFVREAGQPLIKRKRF